MKALIRSIMDYGCIAYDTASLSVKSKLDSVQHKAMRICCGAMTGTPATALQVECGQPPLQLRRQRSMADYSLKIKSIHNHSTATILQDSWQNHYGKFKRGRETFSIKVKQTLQSADIDYTNTAARHGAMEADNSKTRPSTTTETANTTMDSHSGQMARNIRLL